MHLPLWLVMVAGALPGIAWLWLALVLAGRNTLPFPDTGSRIFTAASAQAKATIVALLAEYRVGERFQFNTSGVLRSIVWDGTDHQLPGSGRQAPPGLANGKYRPCFALP